MQCCLACHLGGLRVGAKYQRARHLAGGGSGLCSGPYHQWAILRDIGVLTSVAMYHPDLDFAAIYSGYVDGWSAEDIHSLGESLLPHAKLVVEQVSA